MKLNQIAFGILSACSAFSLLSCGSKGGSSTIANNALVMSSTLSTLQALDVGTCGASDTACTPSNLQGRVYAAGAMLGGGGGPGGFSMTFMADSDAVTQDPSEGKGGTIIFDVLLDDPVSGKAAIPSEAEMPTNNKVTSIEFKFDYLDTTFVLTGTSGVDATYTVRTVFVSEATASDVTGTMYRGDKLIMASGETAFKWCDSSGCSTTRPTSPYQQSAIASWTPFEQGGVEYTTVSFDIADDAQKTFSYATLSDVSKVWTVDLAVANAITFSAAPSTFDAVKTIVDKFAFAYTPSSDGSAGTSALTATFDIADAPAAALNSMGKN